MNTFFFLFLILTTTFILQSVNPVKVVFFIMMLSMVIFLWMAIQSSSVWFPLIFFLLFMGGILIMFLILSSLLPNEKSWKSKKIQMVMAFLAAMSLYLAPAKYNSTGSSFSITEAKNAMMAGSNLIFMTTLVLLYFLIFVSMLSSEKSPLRMPLCCLYGVL